MNDNLLPESKELAIELMMEWRAKAEAFESACERWVEAEKEWKEQLTTSQAQVAVMAEALELAGNAITYAEQHDLGAVIETIKQALSAVPKVVWSGEANVNMYYDLIPRPDGRKALAGRSHTNVDVIVLDKGEGE